MLLFEKDTGCLVAVLLDGGLLTRIRTATAGAIAAKYFAPSSVRGIGIIGAGAQARLQLSHLRAVTPCRSVTVFARPAEHCSAYKQEMEAEGFSVTIADSAAEVAEASNLIVTTTPAREPLLTAGDVRRGTHITAVGADTPEKQELETRILAQADLVVADSLTVPRARRDRSRAAGWVADTPACGRAWSSDRGECATSVIRRANDRRRPHRRSCGGLADRAGGLRDRVGGRVEI
jgi:ornithine cyclodeaminase